MKKIWIYCIGIMLLGACAKPKQIEPKISIEINGKNEIKVEGEVIPVADLQDVLTQRIEEIEDSNIQRDSIIMNFRIDKQAQMGTITDVIKTMQVLKLSNIEYTGVKPQVQGFLPEYSCPDIFFSRKTRT